MRPRATRRLVAAGVVLLALAAAAYGAWRMRPVPATARTPSWVLVGPFDNNTGDPRLDEVLRFALRQGLSESHTLRIVSDERIGDALALMERPRDTPLDRPLAREAALRDGGIRYFTTGRVDRIGSHYALGATLFDAQSGAPVLTAGADLVDVDDALAGIRTLAARLRTAAGEDRQQVRSDVQLEKVTTTSLDALRAYSRGMVLMNRFDNPSADVQFHEALRIDPNFASAYIMLAYAEFNERQPRSAYLPLADRALQLSAGLPTRERLFITASREHMHGNLEKAIPDYTALLTEFPDDYWSANNLAIIYDELGRGPEALPYYYRTADDRPNNFADVIYSAVKALNTTGDWATTKAYAARAQRLPSVAGMTGVAWLKLLPVFELWTRNRVTDASAGLDRVAAQLSMRGWDPIVVGHLQLGLGRVQAAVETFRDHQLPLEAHEFVAEALLARGDVAGARRELQQDPAIYDPAAVPGNWHYIVHELCAAGMIGEAATLVQRASLPEHVQDQVIWPAFIAEARGEVLAAAHRDAEAVAVLDGAQRMMMPGRELMWTDEALAEVLVRRGEVERAASLLRPLRGVRSQLYWLSTSGIYPWLRVRAQLAGIERRLGHEDAARAIEAEVRPLLAVADPDFVVRRTIE